MIKNLNRTVLIAFLALPLVLSGCVSRRAYDENVSMLMENLHRERLARSSETQLLEMKVQERGKTLSELTDRYISLKGLHDSAQGKLGRLQGDLEGLQRDMSELKLIVFTSFRGSQANEMILKLNDMQRRVHDLLNKGVEPMTPPAAAPSPDGQDQDTTPPPDRP